MNRPGISIADFRKLHGTGARSTVVEGITPESVADTLAKRFAGSELIAGKTFDDHEDYREFNADIKKRRTNYVGLGEEGMNCGQWGAMKSCDNGHWFFSSFSCGREWCPHCGEDGSHFHVRRIGRIMPRVFAMGTVGYLVFEVPLVSRRQFEKFWTEPVKRDGKTAQVGHSTLGEARRYIHRLLKREFPNSRGVSRWHFYGDAMIKEHMAELQFQHYHPHLNVLIEHGHMGRKQLKRIRTLWSKWVYNASGKRYYKTAPVFYKYASSPGKKYHLMRYITRSTFKELNSFNLHIAKGLFQFSNTSWFGQFTEADKERGREQYAAWTETLHRSERRSVVEVQSHDAYMSDICPICHAELHVFMVWDRDSQKLVPAREKLANFEVLREFGAGLFEVEPPSWEDEAVMQDDRNLFELPELPDIEQLGLMEAS